MINGIDTTFDFRTDTPPGRDPEDYIRYTQLAIEFIEARSERILKSPECQG
jgi:hypothetical protein